MGNLISNAAMNRGKARAVTFQRHGMPYDRQPGPCMWCLEPGPFEARDHVFPHSLGGTFELAVPSCPTCDGKIQKVENRIARTSIFALRRIVAGPPPGHPKDPASGALDAHYTFGPGADDTLNDVRFRSGGQPPVTLASFQFDTVTKFGHRRFGSNPEDWERFRALLLSARQRAEENHPLDVTVRLLRDDDPHRDNPRFFPRVSL